MPAILAHFQFGMEVMSGLQGEVLDIVKNYMDEYALGLQGPDVLFFYKPYISTKISKVGSLIHDKPGKYFFEKGKMSIRKYRDKSIAAYLIGCVCHYCFDKNAHPFVDEAAPIINQHHMLEAEFDLYVSKKYRYSYPRNNYLPQKLSKPALIGDIYNVSAGELTQSLNDMRLFSAILEKRNLVEKTEKLVGKKGAFSCMSPPTAPAYKEETDVLDSIMHSGVDECREMIYEFYKYIKGELPELTSFEATFGGK
ncbi:MAG: zinc dependent phospholipase C family protein [Clostridia bacterium]|nr:zinc dependent phospholipase C family protein [Clostridia bacterium]MBR5265621.1 zinc dependent phospholipase C family protein [Clostridia bacterium]